MPVLTRLAALGAPLAEESNGVPDLELSVVACMDARMDIYSILGIEVGDAHVIRNAGGVVTDDVIRSLAISQRELRTRVILLIHHTKCGMSALWEKEAEFLSEIEQDVGFRPEWALETFGDAETDVRQLVLRIRANPFVPHKTRVLGAIYDVDTKTLHWVR
ncbi:beta-class carbonic anhydrase [Streptoalloteichus hindustanus]|uniref:carbonic anhydrase n=1 Tax=Streptoalloteichus hindustanus TaxID=2017 RepID=A0A1M5MQQ5_STRHI|nr:carbonic anhydrase [Streptoalloteichus hindustanus]SHG79556.1 carbonic anhydrase [Streptoalloteichus hindustanus]